MNKQTNTTTQPIEARSLPWRNILEELAADTNDIRHRLYLLIGELEDAFDVNRAKNDDGLTVELCFSPQGVDATRWLCYDAHTAITNLRNKLENYQTILMALESDGHAEQVS